MCIFQLPAITRLRTPQTSAELPANLRGCRSAVLDDRFLPGEVDPIAGLELAAAACLDNAIDADGPGLNVVFGFAAGGDPAQPFEELIELHRCGAPGSH